MTSSTLELLAPARNADFGMAAIDHGADAVYIGGPSFGARSGAGNGIADIARLAAYAHRFHARVFVALNTILRDDELEPARRLAWDAFEAGADALIVQDMGLLELDLPPIQLHASTQADIRTPQKARFLQDAGFSQLVLARELALPEIVAIGEALNVGAGDTAATLEYFVHGALCVAYSGQCYISHAHTGRSANRGECSQACRLPYTLEDESGAIVAHDKHLLSMKDNDQSANLRALVAAGIRSFKIEGRLKDLGYVKNITAHYRQLIDALLEGDDGMRRASSGRSVFAFAPQPRKTFNRGATDYFVHGRRADIGAFDTPKFAGEPVGEILRRASGCSPECFEAATGEPLNNGDGLSYFAPGGALAGLRVNRVERLDDGGVDGRAMRWRIFPAEMPADLGVGSTLYRNRDQAFERALEKPSATRRIAVRMRLAPRADGFALELVDEDGIAARATLRHPREPARNAGRALAGLREGLARLGHSPFAATQIVIDVAPPCFLPAAAVNGLRRDAVAALEAAREAARPRLPRRVAVSPAPTFPEGELSYLGNVLNRAARAFYRRHGVSVIADAYEADREPGEVSLMITRHCLRYSFNLCPREVKGLRPEPMTLVNGNERLTLRFDCKRCEMHVVGRRRAGRRIDIVPVAS